MALARCGVIILLLPVIALTSASKASAKGRHVVTEATSLSESIMALDELVQGSVLRSIRSFERIIKEEFDYLGNLDVAKTIHVKDKNVPISSAKLAALAEESKTAAYQAIQDANRKLVDILAKSIVRSQGSKALLERLGHHLNFDLKSNNKESVKDILNSYDEDIQNILADVDSVIQDSFNDKFMLLSESLAILLEGHVSRKTLQESGAALAEYAKQAARTVVLQQTAKVKAVLEQALKHAEKLSAASPSALGKEKAAIIKAIRHISSLKDEEMVFKAIKIAVYFLKKEYKSIHDKVTSKGH